MNFSNNPQYIKVMQTENDGEIKSLFDFISFSDKEIQSFKNILQIKQQKILGMNINKSLFFEKNENGEMFIEVLATMNSAKTTEEVQIRLFLLAKFCEVFYDKNYNKKAYTEIIREEIPKVIEDKYDDMFKKYGIKPKFTLNEYCNQLKEAFINKNNTEEVTNKVSLILDNYFADLENIAYQDKEISFAALAVKVKANAIFHKEKFNNTDFYIQKFEYKNFARIYSEKYQLNMTERDFFIEVVSESYISKLGLLQEINSENDLIKPLLIETYNNFVLNLLRENKILTNYETLSAELGTNNNIKVKKQKL